MMLYNMTRQKGLQFVLRLNKYWLLSLQEKFTNQVFVQIHKSISIYIYIYIYQKAQAYHLLLLRFS